VPILRGAPAWHAALRSSAGGALLTEQLLQLLRLRYPLLGPGLLGDAAAEALKERHCEVAGDYASQLRAIAAAPDTAGARGRKREAMRTRGAALLCPDEGRGEAPALAGTREPLVPAHSPLSPTPQAARAC
jgi:hypothetical protein